MTATGSPQAGEVPHEENPYAGQGSVLLDIGGEVGALVVRMPEEMLGEEVEIRPVAPRSPIGHLPHVAAVRRPTASGPVASLVFPELREQRYELLVKGSTQPVITVEVRGGEVTEASWPR